MPVKHFNTAGPNKLALHYSIDPLTRIDLAAVRDLIAQQRFFVLHAPRRSGKTTCLLALRDELNSGQRVVSGAGRIECEYAAGSGRLDLLVSYGDVSMAIEVKVWRDGRKDPIVNGLQQIERYLHRLAMPEGYLVIFDQRSTAANWEARMQTESTFTASGKPVLVLRG